MPWGRLRPRDASAAARRPNEQAPPRGRRPEVGGVEDLPFHAVVQRFDHRDERSEDLASLGLQRAIGLAERAPLHELRHVLDQDLFDVQVLQPPEHVPGARPALVVNRLPPTRRGVEHALGRRDQEIELAARHRHLRVECLDRRAEVPGLWVIPGVRLHRDRPVIHGDQFDPLAALGRRLQQACRAAAGAGEEIDRLHARTCSPRVIAAWSTTIGGPDSDSCDQMNQQAVALSVAPFPRNE